MGNLGAFQRWFGVQPNTKVATLVFGLFDGFGLAAKIQEYDVAQDGLVPNLLAFDVSMELGQARAVCGQSAFSRGQTPAPQVHAPRQR